MDHVRLGVGLYYHVLKLGPSNSFGTWRQCPSGLVNFIYDLCQQLCLNPVALVISIIDHPENIAISGPTLLLRGRGKVWTASNGDASFPHGDSYS